MKKIGILFILLFSINLVSAVNINIQDIYNPGETLIASIEGNFVSPLTAEQIYFYDGRIQVPLIYDLGKIQDKYYLYAILPVKERNLTLLIKQAHYLENTFEYKEDIMKNFSIKGNITDFSVSPGFIITTSDFSVNAASLNERLNVKAEFLGEEQEIEVPPGQTKKITFSSENIKNSTFTEITLSSGKTAYKIPVFISPSSNVSETKNQFRFSSSRLERTISTKSDWIFNVYLLNLGEEDIKNIRLESNLKDLEISPSEISLLGSGSSEEISLTFNIGEEREISGEISAVSGSLSSKLLIAISALKNETKVAESATPSSKSCSEINGISCLSNEACTGYKEYTLEGICCVGKCEPVKAESSSWIWLLIIAVVIAAILFFVFIKLKTRKKTSKEFLKEKEKSYEDRFKGLETRGNLARE